MKTYFFPFFCLLILASCVMNETPPSISQTGILQVPSPSPVAMVRQDPSEKKPQLSTGSLMIREVSKKAFSRSDQKTLSTNSGESTQTQKIVAKPLPSLRERLTSIQYEVTQNGATETPYKNPYWDNHESGIYVDIIDGTPLFSSRDKFDSGTGWPSFTRPIDSGVLLEKSDFKIGEERVEVIGKKSSSHLGHVFDDGPVDQGGKRYCINSASLRFISYSDLKKEGYGKYSALFQ